MGKTNRGDPCVVNDGASYPRPPYEATQYIQEIFGLSKKAIGGRRCPGFELPPMHARGGVAASFQIRRFVTMLKNS